MIRIRSRGARDAATERRRQEAEALGIPLREGDKREPFRILIERPGLPPIKWRAEPRAGRATQWRVVDVDAGTVVMCSAPRAIVQAAAALMPLVGGFR